MRPSQRSLTAPRALRAWVPTHSTWAIRPSLDVQEMLSYFLHFSQRELLRVQRYIQSAQTGEFRSLLHQL